MEAIFLGLGIVGLVLIGFFYIFPLIGNVIFISILLIKEKPKKEDWWFVGLGYFLSVIPMLNIVLFFILWYISTND